MLRLRAMPLHHRDWIALIRVREGYSALARAISINEVARDPSLGHQQAGAVTPYGRNFATSSRDNSN